MGKAIYGGSEEKHKRAYKKSEGRSKKKKTQKTPKKA